MSASSKSSRRPRRYLAIWLSHLPTDRIERSRARQPAEARIIVRDVRGALRLCAMNAEAMQLGLRHMMPLADARAMYPGIAVETADDNADTRLLEAVADWLSRYTPLVGLTPPDGTMLDITGCAHLFGGEEAMRRDAVRRLRDQGLTARTAIAGTPGAAWALARHGERRNIDDGELRETMRPLPLAALQLKTEIVEALARLGLKKVGDIMDRPRAPLAARFGASLLHRLDCMMGEAEEPITPRLPVAPHIAERNFMEPVTHEDMVLQTVAHLGGELARRMEERGEGARELQVTLFRVDGVVRRLSVATARPQRDPVAIHRLFRERFASLVDELDAGYGFDVIRLAVTIAEKQHTPQSNLVDNATGADDVAGLVDRFGVRFGQGRVKRLGLAESHIPEYAMTCKSPLDAEDRDRTGHITPDAPAPNRPLRLFERPEPVDAIAEVPDGPPIRFRWRRVQHEVAKAEGPERIAMEWWRDESGRGLTRDYFRVEDRDGRRYWLYREGLFGSETARPQWYMHGLFA